MAEYNEGDLVEAVKGSRRVSDLIVLPGHGSTWRESCYLGTPSLLAPSSIASYLRAGWTVTTIKKADRPVVLPRATVMFKSGFIATWWDESLSWSITGYKRAWGDPAEVLRFFGSEFVVLEPVAETAKKVLDRVLKDWYGQSVPGRALRDVILAIGREFETEANAETKHAQVPREADVAAAVAITQARLKEAQKNLIQIQRSIGMREASSNSEALDYGSDSYLGAATELATRNTALTDACVHILATYLDQDQPREWEESIMELVKSVVTA